MNFDQFIRTCMFFSERESNVRANLTEPTGLKRLLLIRDLMGFITKHFYKFGKQNGIETIDDNRDRLTLIVMCPKEMQSFLEYFKDRNEFDKGKIIEYFKKHSPTAWTALNNFPDRGAKDFDTLMNEMFKAQRTITDNAYNDPVKKDILIQSNAREPIITSNICEEGFDNAGQRPVDKPV
jgi:hypothetical protein